MILMLPPSRDFEIFVLCCVPTAPRTVPGTQQALETYALK